MKKALLLFVCTALLFTSAIALAADVDLTSLPYDELVDLKIKIAAEVMSRPETKSVSVPPGVYEIGEHIPAGEYSLELDSDYAAATTSKSNDFSDYGSMIDILSVDEKGVGRIVLKEGQFIQIEYGSVLFVTFTGLNF